MDLYIKSDRMGSWVGIPTESLLFEVLVSLILLAEDVATVKGARVRGRYEGR